jgi:nickel-dependent lactate racemase
MPTVRLGYGNSAVELPYDASRFTIFAPDESQSHRLSDAEIQAALDRPIESPRLEELIGVDDTVLIVVSDATRATGSAQLVELLLRRLSDRGVAAGNVAIIFATGIHRAVRPEEKVQLLGASVADRVRIIDHDASDEAQCVAVGAMASGTTVRVNRALQEFSKVILTGAVGFHYFAGFTGGRKSICPGLASAQTIEATHMLALDFETGGRRRGVGTGLLDGNAVHEECERVAAVIAPAFSINTIVDEQGQIEKVFAGDWRAAHRRACEDYLAHHSRRIEEKREVVVVSCGGWPWDINMIQAHKALDMAAHACHEGGTIVFLAECADGLGRADFMKWFAAADSRALGSRLRDRYEVNGQTAWSLLTKTERFHVRIVTRLGEDEIRRMRMEPVRSMDDGLATARSGATGYVLPRGAALFPLS